MKYWRGYVAALIFGGITAAAVGFAKAHPVLVDMVYPYLTRIFIGSMAQWSAGTAVCLWFVLLIFLIMGIIASGVLVIFILRKSWVQWLGWVCAIAMGITMVSTVAYSLNAYASPLADDIRLEISDYTVTELNDATIYFRDQANALAEKVDPSHYTFEQTAQKAGRGFQILTTEKAISVFAGADAPVKKLPLAGLFTTRGNSGVTVAITGEAAVNPNVPEASLPFAICKEMAHRISIYTEADANFAAFLACINNPDPYYQYSGYLMAYYYCYHAIQSIPTSTAQACAERTDAGVSSAMRKDLDKALKFYGRAKSTPNVQSSANITDSSNEITLISFSSYSDVADLFASWYIQEHILPKYEEENPVQEFDPLDETQVDLAGLIKK